MFDEWAKQIAGAGGYNSGNIYQNYARSAGPNMTASANAGREAGAKADIEAEQQRRAQAAAEAEAKKIIDEDDPSKAQMVMRPNGEGYDFYNGAGKKIGINEFSLIVGKKPAEILADSDNPRDQRFVQDYKTISALSNAWVNGDQETLSKFREADPKKFNELISKYKTPGDMMKGFTQFYSDYYGSTQDKNQIGNQPFGLQQKSGADKKTAKALAGTSLQQVMQPSPKNPPAFSPGLKGVLEKAPVLNRFTGQRDARRRFNDEINSNPWLRYQNDILNGANTRGWFSGFY